MAAYVRASLIIDGQDWRTPHILAQAESDAYSDHRKSGRYTLYAEGPGTADIRKLFKVDAYGTEHVTFASNSLKEALLQFRAWSSVEKVSCWLVHLDHLKASDRVVRLVAAMYLMGVPHGHALLDDLREEEYLREKAKTLFRRPTPRCKFVGFAVLHPQETRPALLERDGVRYSIFEGVDFSSVHAEISAAFNAGAPRTYLFADARGL